MRRDGEDEDASASSSGEDEEEKRLAEDPWDIKPEFVDKPPHDTTSFRVGPAENLLFYQRSRFPIYCMMAHTESEVVITNRRVMITQADTVRGIPGIHNLGFQFRMRQHVIDRKKVAGYSAGAVQPRCWHLVLGIVLFFVSFFYLLGGQYAVVLSLRLLNPMSWMRTFADHSCKELGLCGEGADSFAKSSSLMQLPRPAPLRGALRGERESGGNAAGVTSSSASSSTGSFLELRPTGHLLAKPTPSSGRPKSTKSGGFPVLSPSDGSQETPGSLLESHHHSRSELGYLLHHRMRSRPDSSSEGGLSSQPPPNSPQGCEDFPKWVDSNSSGCTDYTDNNKWSLACTGYGSGSGTSPGHDSARFERRRDSTALRLSALEACCICGGGYHVAINLGVPRLVDSLWPVVVAESSSPSPAGLSANRLSAAGRAAFTSAIRHLPASELTFLADTVAKLRTGEIVSGMSQSPEELQTLLGNLERTPEISQVRRGLSEQPLSALTMNAMNLDMGDAEAVARNSWWMTFYAWLAYLQPVILCMVNCLSVIFFFLGLGLVGNWFLEQRGLDRLYVTLKVHKDYFGDNRDLQQDDKRPFVKGNYKVEQLFGFYLPPLRQFPYKLREMSNALMAPFDDTADETEDRARSNSMTTTSGLDRSKTATTLGTGSRGVRFGRGDDSD